MPAIRNDNSRHTRDTRQGRDRRANLTETQATTMNVVCQSLERILTNVILCYLLIYEFVYALDYMYHRGTSECITSGYITCLAETIMVPIGC